MTAKTYVVSQYQVYWPTTRWYLSVPAGSPVFARIACWGSSGESMVLDYLRPDAANPGDDPPPPTPVLNTYDASTDVAQVYRLANEFAWDRNLLASGSTIVAQVDDVHPGGMGVSVQVNLPPQTSDTVPDLLQWLGQNPTVANAIAWDDGAAALLKFASWSQQQQQALVDSFSQAWNSVPSGNADPPAGLGTDPNAATISAADAWTLYLAHVAHSLALELRGAVPWSLTQLDAYDLSRVLSVRDMFFSTTGGYQMMTGSVPADPLYAYSFLVSGGLVGASRLDTIARVLGWCRRYLRHFDNTGTSDWGQVYWQYEGVPARRMIDGTVSSDDPTLGLQHWTAGCSGTTAFLKSLLRVANIPVERLTSGGHAMPWFTSENCGLSHGDDPYDALNKAVPPVDSSELLIDQATWDSWLGSSLTMAQQAANVGRQGVVIALQALPDYWLHYHWLDLADGTAPADSEVYKSMKAVYPNINDVLWVWPALDRKLAAFARRQRAWMALPLPPWVKLLLPRWVGEEMQPRMRVGPDGRSVNVGP